jgi:hypothetical protein
VSPTLDEAAARALLAALRSARAKLLARPAREVAGVLGRVGARFLTDGDPLRRKALSALPASAGISAPMAREILDGMAADWRTDRLLALLDTELHGGRPLDGFVDAGGGRKTRALGPELTVHVCAGTVPGVSVTSLIRGLLCKSAVLLKPGRGDEVLPDLFLVGLAEADPDVANAADVVYWKGGSGDTIERIALSDADLVVVYGGDDSVEQVRAAARATTPVVAYPHRLSFAVVGSSEAAGPERWADPAARAVAIFDQRGCVSPHAFFVLGGTDAADRFAAALAQALERLESRLPSGSLDPREASQLQQLRGTAEMEGAMGRGRVWSGGAGSWTAVRTADPELEPSCPGRFVRIHAVDAVADVLASVARFRRNLQTVGVAGLDSDQMTELCEGFARLGGVRVAPLEQTPWPPPWWHHDGMGPLSALLRWTDWE